MTLAHQWFGVGLHAKSPKDAWLIVGVASHLTRKYMHVAFGWTEARYGTAVREAR